MKLECKTHGLTEFMANGKNYTGSKKYKCRQCSRDSVNKNRRLKRKKLVDYAGGECRICGYKKYVGALQFHHKDPSQKDFTLSTRIFGKSMKVLKQEVDKCILLCANCHAEVHANIVNLPQ